LTDPRKNLKVYTIMSFWRFS